jgi:hypothetical protein
VPHLIERRGALDLTRGRRDGRSGPERRAAAATGDVGVSGAGVPDGDGVGEAVGVADGDAGSASAAPVHPARRPVRRISEASATGTDADFDLVTLTAEC